METYREYGDDQKKSPRKTKTKGELDYMGMQGGPEENTGLTKERRGTTKRKGKDEDRRWKKTKRDVRDL
jgi:hypothetical protein